MVGIASVTTLLFLVGYSLILVLVQIKPFWIDEWRVIYNLKYKSPTMLLGQLDFMQQFPRVYLEIIKGFTSMFDYSYLTLRLPSFLVGTFAIIFCYRLMKKIFPAAYLNRFLLVMIMVSSYPFTEYFVQVKQYTMDILLSLVAIWQLLELLRIKEVFPGKGRYLLLCFSFFICPFFSYTYPIAVAPVFLIVLIHSVDLFRRRNDAIVKRKIFRLWLPLFLGVISIGVFYLIDVAQLMADKGMRQFWGPLMMNDGFSWGLFFINVYLFLSEAGSGLVYTVLFGVLGIISFGYGIYQSRAILLRRTFSNGEAALVYSVLLIVVAIILFIADKLPLGNARLNAFTIPSVFILVICLLDQLKNRVHTAKLSKTLSLILYVGVIGNIYTTC